MSIFDTSAGVPVGLGSPSNMYRMAYNRTGGTTAIGDIVMFDIALDETETTNADMGGTASAFSNVVVPADTVASLVYGFFAVCMEVAADNKLMRVCVKGLVPANLAVAYTAVDMTVGRFAAVAAADTLALVGGTGTAADKCIAIGVQAHATDTQVRVLFDGLDGFGVI
jgi:hypothetical protein